MPITFLDDKKEQPGNGITFLDNAGSAGISFLDVGRNATGEEVTNRQASNPASAELMNRDDYVRMLEYKRDNPVSWGTIAINGAVGLADVAGGTIKELGGATRDAFNAPAPKGSISQLGVADLSRLNPVGETVARGAFAGFNQLAGMALDMMSWNDDSLISYPKYLSANNLSDTSENKQKHEFELNKQFEEFKRSQFAKAQTKDILEKSPLPATSEAVSLFAQPEFGAGALMARIGMGAKLGRAAADIGSVAGEATQKLGKGLTTLSEMPKKLAVATAEELTSNPRVASRVGSAVQTGTTGAVIAGMGGFAIPGVYEASKLITATKIAGEVLDVAGEVTKKISEFAKGETGRIGAFENLANDLTASSSARTIGKIATLGGVDSITPYMSAALQGAAGGAVVGGTLGFLADGGEGMAAGVGMGLTLGAGGGLAGRGLQAASGAQRRSQIINDATKGVLNLSEASKGNAAKLFDSLIRRDGQEAVAELIDTTKWLNGAVKFEYITNEQAKSMPEAIGVGFEGITVAPKKGETGTPTVFINIDRVNPGTGFHEGFHGAMRTALGDVYAPKFNELISKSFSQKEIDDFVSSYINRAEDPAVKDVLKSYLEKKGNLPEEIGAEYFRQFLQQKENRDILLRGQRTTNGALLNATKSAIDFSLNRLGVTQESYKTGYKGMDKLVTELIGARTAINKSIAKNGVPLAEVPLMKMPAQEIAVWAKTQGQSDVLLKDDAGNVIGVKTEDQVNLQRDLANTKAAADLADVPRGKNNLTDAELAVYQKYLPPEHFARLVYIVDAINTGKVINGDYFPATSKEGETSVYASRGMTTRDFVPYGIKVSKAGAISVMGLDMTQLRARFDDYMSRPGVDKLWDGNKDAALMDVQLYAENLSKGDAAVPSEQLFGKNKRDVLYKIFGFAPTKAILKAGGLVNPSSLGTNVRAESSAGPMQIGKPVDAYSNDTRLTTSFRLDRLGRVSDIGQSFQFNEGGSYKLSQVNFQVAEKIGSGEVWRSKDDQYKIIVKGNKHVVYNGNDKIGIFGNLADASSHIYKAEAKANKVAFMPADSDYMAAAKSGDTKAAQQMVDQAAKAAGYDVAAIHGTNVDGITTLKLSESGYFGKAIYLTKNDITAGHYGKNKMRVYVKMTNPWKMGEWGNGEGEATYKEAWGKYAEPDKTGRPLYINKSALGNALRADGHDGFIASGEMGVFNPSQIKSADPITRDDAGTIIPLSQRFKGSDDIRFMPSESPEAKFYSSRIISAVENSSQGKANGSQWKATIKNSKLGVNQDEYALTRVEDLEAGKTYTKAEVLDYLRANEVVVKDVTLGGVPDGVEVKRKAIEAKIDASTLVTDAMKAGYNQLDAANLPWRIRDGRTNISSLPESILDEAKRVDALWKEWDGLDKSISNQTTHFSDYTLPGAKEGSYREVLLTVPEVPNSNKFEPSKVDVRQTTRSVTQGSTSIWYDGKRLADYGDNPKLQSGGGYEQMSKNYWMEVAKELFEKGDERNSIGPLGNGWRDGHSQYSDIPNPIVRLRTNERTTADGKRMLFIEEIQAPQKKQFEKMPALFQKNWRDIGFKWAFRKAAEGGFDSVGWTTGEQQAARYHLSKEVEVISYNVDAQTLSASRGKDTGKHYIIDKMVVAPDKLHEVIGKAAAYELLNNPTLKSNGTHHLSGEDLKVGGGGLRKLYDQDFSNVVNNLPIIKKSGQKVGTETIYTDRSEQVNSINVTPEMRNASVSFMPAMQFSAPENLPNGKVWRGDNGYAIMQKEGGKFRVHSPIGLIGIASSYEAAEKMASKRNNK